MKKKRKKNKNNTQKKKKKRNASRNNDSLRKKVKELEQDDWIYDSNLLSVLLKQWLFLYYFDNQTLWISCFLFGFLFSFFLFSFLPLLSIFTTYQNIKKHKNKKTKKHRIIIMIIIIIIHACQFFPALSALFFSFAPSIGNLSTHPQAYPFPIILFFSLPTFLYLPSFEFNLSRTVNDVYVHNN